MKHEGSPRASLVMKVFAEVPPTLKNLECCQVLSLVIIPGFIKYKNKTLPKASLSMKVILLPQSSRWPTLDGLVLGR